MSFALCKTKPDQLAFGVVPAFRRFELYQARYHQLVPVVRGHLNGASVSVLDIGAGEGSAKRFVDTLAGPAQWTAVEIDPRRAALLKELGYRVTQDVDLEHGRLPFDDEQFDVVIASHVLEHLDNAPAAFADWMRVVKRGGSLVLGVPMHPGWLAGLARLKFRLWGRRPRGHCHFFSMRTLRRFLQPWQVRRIWGFRLFSARQQLPLEDWEWFFKASLWLGTHFPSLAGEVNVHVVKP